MSIGWLVPAALAGIALIALPIAVHLLVRQLARRVAFPSLRFLRETQLAAWRRRRIEDVWLLACRALIIAAAAVALAGPVLRSESRTASFASRTARAIVPIDALDDSTRNSLREGAFKSEIFTRNNVTDALADASRWLDTQPPASREIVVAGALRRGSITEADIARIPADVGIRFHPIQVEAPAEATISILTRRDGTLMKVDRLATMTADATKVVEGAASRVSGDLVTIAARAEDSELATAALRAALGAGVPWTDFATPVLVVWEGAERSDRQGVRVISMAVPHPASSAADAVYAALVRGTPRPDLKEPIAVTREQLEQWTRSPGPVSPNAPLSDEGDRRWVWAAVLLLVILETYLRRSKAASAAPREEARVA